MKKLLILSLFYCFSTCLFSQDIILTTDNDSIKAKVITVYDAVTKYVLFNDKEGTSYFIANSRIKTITYENGEVETFLDANQNNAQENTTIDIPKVAHNEKIFKNVIRINPLVPIMALFTGVYEVEVQYARYLGNKVAIPLDIDIGGTSDATILIFMTGVEAIPATYRQKSGLYLNGLVGPMIVTGPTVVNAVHVAASASIGYQFMTKRGFVLNAGLGPIYNSLENKVKFHISLFLGFAF